MKSRGSSFVRKPILWLPSQREKGEVMSFHDNRVVFPSRVGQNSPISECSTRVALPEEGVLEEECVLFEHSSGRSFVAYPTVDAAHYVMPGVRQPHTIKWDRDAQDPQNVISSIVPENYGRYFRVFAGDSETYDKFADKSKMEYWSHSLTEGQETEVYICWMIRKKLIMGYAYPIRRHVQTVQVDALSSYDCGLGVLLAREDVELVKTTQGKSVTITIVRK